MNRAHFVNFAVFALGAAALAQPATPAQMAGVDQKPGYATMHLKTSIGSFKMIDCEGRAEVSCQGTLMINSLKGSLDVRGDLKKLYEDRGRVVYFGKGTVVLTGTWRSVQWFGKNMNAVWYGKGVIRIQGEFDKNLYTGEYWYDNPADKNAWFANASYQLVLPPPPDDSDKVKARERGEVKKKPNR